MSTTVTEPLPADAAAQPKPKVNWIDELRGLALMLLAVLAFHSFIAKPFYIPSISMMPNLLVGDRLVVSKYPFGWNWSSFSFHVFPRGDWRLAGSTPQYGDIVIVVPNGRTDDLIKRVVALPGDRIAVRNGQIVLNGRPVPQAVDASADPRRRRLAVRRRGGGAMLRCLWRVSDAHAFGPRGLRAPDAARNAAKRRDVPDHRSYDPTVGQYRRSARPGRPRFPDGRQPRSLGGQPRSGL